MDGVCTVDRRMEQEGGAGGMGTHRGDRRHLHIATAAVVDTEDDGVHRGILRHFGRNRGMFAATIEDVISICAYTRGSEDLLSALHIIQVDSATVCFLVILSVRWQDGHWDLVAILVFHHRRQSGRRGTSRIIIQHRGSQFDTGTQCNVLCIHGLLQAIRFVAVRVVELDGANLFLMSRHSDRHKQSSVTHRIVGIHTIEHVVVVAAVLGIGNIVAFLISGIIDIFRTLVAVFREGPNLVGVVQCIAINTITLLEHNPIVAVGASTVDGRLLPSCCTEIPVVPVGRLLEGLTHLAAHNFQTFIMRANDIVAVGLLIGVVEPFLIVISCVARTVPHTVEIESAMGLGDNPGLGGIRDIQCQVGVALSGDMGHMLSAMGMNFTPPTRGVESHRVFPVVIRLVLHTIGPPQAPIGKCEITLCRHSLRYQAAEQ